MLKSLIATGIRYILPNGCALKLIQNSINVNNSTNPLILSKNITLAVTDCCAPPPVRLTTHYVSAGALIVA